MGIEEEYFLVHPTTRAPEPAAARVIARAAKDLGDRVTGEFTQYQIEIRTSPCAVAERRPAPRFPRGIRLVNRRDGLLRRHFVVALECFAGCRIYSVEWHSAPKSQILLPKRLQ